MTAGSDYFEQVLQELGQSQPEAAFPILQSAAEAHPEDPRPLFLMAAGFAQSQDYDRAEGAYIATLQRAPGFAIARFQLGLLQFTSGRPSAALSSWAPLDQLGEQHYLWMFKQGFTALAQDQFEEARQWLQQGIAANQENAPLNQDMAMMIQRIDQAGVNPPASDAPAAPADAPPSGDSHFLLSAYRKLQ